MIDLMCARGDVSEVGRMRKICAVVRLRHCI